MAIILFPSVSPAVYNHIFTDCPNFSKFNNLTQLSVRHVSNINYAYALGQGYSDTQLQDCNRFRGISNFRKIISRKRTTIRKVFFFSRMNWNILRQAESQLTTRANIYLDLFNIGLCRVRYRLIGLSIIFFLIIKQLQKILKF